MNKKWPWITALIITILSLAVGASFHGLRMHPENADSYKLGITMGTIMLAAASVSFAVFIVTLVIYKMKKK